MWIKYSKIVYVLSRIFLILLGFKVFGVGEALSNLLSGSMDINEKRLQSVLLLKYS